MTQGALAQHIRPLLQSCNTAKFHPVGGKLVLARNPNLALPLIPYDFTTYIGSPRTSAPCSRPLSWVHTLRISLIKAVNMARRARALIQESALEEDDRLTPIFELVDASLSEALEAFSAFAIRSSGSAAPTERRALAACAWACLS